MRISKVPQSSERSLFMTRLVCTLKYGRYALGSLTAVLFLVCAQSS